MACWTLHSSWETSSSIPGWAIVAPDRSLRAVSSLERRVWGPFTRPSCLALLGRSMLYSLNMHKGLSCSCQRLEHIYVANLFVAATTNLLFWRP